MQSEGQEPTLRAESKLHEESKDLERNEGGLENPFEYQQLNPGPNEEDKQLSEEHAQWQQVSKELQEQVVLVDPGQPSRSGSEIIQPQDSQGNCPICYQPKELKILHGECKFCEECVMRLISGNLQNSLRDFELEYFFCPSGCGTSVYYTKIYETFSKQSVDSLNEHRALAYTKRTPDIICCPNSGCKYAGFYTPDHINCKKPFQCEECQTFIQHPILREGSERGCRDFLSRFVKAFTTKSCPRCGAQITKNGGCDHMTCTRCQHNFNWSSVYYPGWRIVTIILLPVLLVLTWNYYMEIWSFLLIIKPYVVPVLLWIAKFLFLMALICLNIAFCVFIAGSRDHDGIKACITLATFTIDFVWSWLFPEAMKTVVVDVFFVICASIILAMILAFAVCVGWGIIAICNVCWDEIKRARRRRLERLELENLLSAGNQSHDPLHVELAP